MLPIGTEAFSFMFVVDYSTDIPDAARYVTFVDEETTDFGLAEGRQAMFVVPCASAVAAEQARGLAEGLPSVWAVRTRVDRPQAHPTLRHFVIDVEQLDRLQRGAAPPDISESTLAVIAELCEDEDLLVRGAAAILDDATGAELRRVVRSAAALDAGDFAALCEHVRAVGAGLCPTRLAPHRGRSASRVA